MAKQLKFMNEKELRILAAQKGIKVEAGTPLKEIRSAISANEETKLKTETTSEILTYDEKLKKEPRKWVRVQLLELEVDVDFGFTFEGHRWSLMNGGVVRLPESVINHLRALRYPKVKYKQGEAGTGVKVSGYYYSYAITEVDAPGSVAAAV